MSMLKASSEPEALSQSNGSLTTSNQPLEDNPKMSDSQSNNGDVPLQKENHTKADNELKSSTVEETATTDKLKNELETKEVSSTTDQSEDNQPVIKQEKQDGDYNKPLQTTNKSQPNPETSSEIQKEELEKTEQQLAVDPNYQEGDENMQEYGYYEGNENDPNIPYDEGQEQTQGMEGEEGYYYDDQEYYEDDDGQGPYEEEEEEETFRELVKGPNGRLQYVVKGPDGRIKCIMDAPPDAVLQDEPAENQRNNPENYPGQGNGEFLEGDDEEFYEEDEQYAEGEVVNYEEGEVPQQHSEYQERQFPASGQRQISEGMQGYPVDDMNYDEMDEEGEYYDEDEDDDDDDGMFNFTDEQLELLRKQHQEREKQILLQKQQQKQQQLASSNNPQKQSSNLNKPIPQSGQPANIKQQQTPNVQKLQPNPTVLPQNTQPVQPQKTIISQSDPQKTPVPQNTTNTGQKLSAATNPQNLNVVGANSGVINSQTGPSVPPSQTVKSSQNMKGEYPEEEDVGEEGSYYSDDDDDQFFQSKEYLQMVMQQRMHGNKQNTQNFPNQNVQQFGQNNMENYYDDEEYYDEDEEDEYEGDEVCSNDSAIEAYIQQAIEERQRKEQGVKGLLQYRPKISNQNMQDNPQEQNTVSQNQNTDVESQSCVPNSGTVTSKSLNTDTCPNSKTNLLNNISLNNLSFKDKSGPIMNMVYLIRSNHGKDVYAMWDGKNFVPTPKKVSASLPSEALSDSGDDSKIVGGGGKGKGAKGSATGPETSEPEENERRPKPRVGNMVSLSSHKSVSPVPLKHGDLLPNGRVWQHTPNPHLLARRPLHPDDSGKEDSNDKSYNSTENNESSGKRPLENSNLYAVCKACGYSSIDLEKCESCFRKFPPDTKFRSVDEIRKNPSTPGVGTKAFYSQRFNDQSQPYKYARLQNDRRSVGGNVVSRGRKPRNYRRSMPSKPLNATVTISSDDEFSDHTENQSDVSNNVLHDFSNTGDSPIFPNRPEPIRPIKGSLKDRMEDQNGQIVNKNRKRRNSKTDSIEGNALSLFARSIRIGSLKTKPIDSIYMSKTGMDCFVLCERKGNHKCRFEIAASDIVSCQGHLNPPVFVMFFVLTPPCGEKLREKLKMKNNDMGIHYDPESENPKYKYCVMILDKLEDSERLKEFLNHYRKQNDGGTDFYQDLTHEEANDLLLKSTPLTAAMQAQVGMKKIPQRKSVLSTPAQVPKHDPSNPMDESRDDEYSRDENESYDQSDYREDSRSPTPPRVTFTGPIEKLLTYPPPPAKGALTVTNEDLYCLNEGEFLNDVIIDFYLKYLLLEKMTERDRQRTHVFSSFFYKRLTHKIPKIAESSADCNKQPHVKRHSRVKTWTRHVDLFEKDFIIVPINEHSHWFLAIICFPGLEDPQLCPFLPIPLKTKTTPKQSPVPPETTGEPTPEAEKTETDTQATDQETPMETEEVIPSKVITGMPLDPEKCIEESDNREYCLGKKQACILVFDSLAGPSRAAVVRILKEYLQVEWSIKKEGDRNFKDCRGLSPKIPQQNNFSDCGIYVLQYVESFFETPIMDFSSPMKGIENWFLHEVVAGKREYIKNLVLQLKELHTRVEKKS